MAEAVTSVLGGHIPESIANTLAKKTPLVGERVTLILWNGASEIFREHTRDSWAWYLAARGR